MAAPRASDGLLFVDASASWRDRDPKERKQLRSHVMQNSRRARETTSSKALVGRKNDVEAEAELYGERVGLGTRGILRPTKPSAKKTPISNNIASLPRETLQNRCPYCQASLRPDAVELHICSPVFFEKLQATGPFCLCTLRGKAEGKSQFIAGSFLQQSSRIDWSGAPDWIPFLPVMPDCAALFASSYQDTLTSGESPPTLAAKTKIIRHVNVALRGDPEKQLHISNIFAIVYLLRNEVMNGNADAIRMHTRGADLIVRERGDLKEILERITSRSAWTNPVHHSIWLVVWIVLQGAIITEHAPPKSLDGSCLRLPAMSCPSFRGPSTFLVAYACGYNDVFSDSGTEHHKDTNTVLSCMLKLTNLFLAAKSHTCSVTEEITIEDPSHRFYKTAATDMIKVLLLSPLARPPIGDTDTAPGHFIWLTTMIYILAVYHDTPLSKACGLLSTKLGYSVPLALQRSTEAAGMSLESYWAEDVEPSSTTTSGALWWPILVAAAACHQPWLRRDGERLAWTEQEMETELVRKTLTCLSSRCRFVVRKTPPVIIFAALRRLVRVQTFLGEGA